MTPSRSEDLHIETSESPNGARIFKLIGPLTLRTLFEFQTLSRTDHTAPVIIDIGGVPYMDSAGLGSMIGVFTSCQRSHRGFGIVKVSERIRTLFEVTGCNGMLPCYDSIEAADAAVHH